MSPAAPMVKPVLSADEVNALPERVRDYIMWFETNADPGHTVRENFRLTEENAGLRSMIAEHRAAAAQEAVAWFTDDHLTDRSATTYDATVAERWRAKGWPVTPLHAAPVAAAPVDLYRQLFEAAMNTAHAAMEYVQRNQEKFNAKAGDDKLEIICREFLRAQVQSTSAAPGIDLTAIDKEISLWAGRMSTKALNQRWPESRAIHAALVKTRRSMIDASLKGGDVHDDRFPRGLIDAIEYADNMEEAAEVLYQHVFEHESDGEDNGTVILQRVLGCLKDSPKGGSTVTNAMAEAAAIVVAGGIEEWNDYPEHVRDGLKEIQRAALSAALQATSAEVNS